MKVPEFSVKRPVTISMLIGVVVVLGLFSFYHLGLEMLPDITYPIVSAVTSYPGASSEDVEQAVTRPIEQMVSSVSRVKSVKSISQEGMSIVMIEFSWGTNLDFAAQDIRDQVNMYKGFLPEGANDPVVFKFDISQMPIAVYAATGMDDQAQLYEQLDDVADRLERIDGVAAVILLGGDRKQVSVQLDPVKLETMKLSTNSIIQSLMFNNINIPAGYIDFRNKEFLLRTAGEFKSIDEIGEVLVGVSETYEPIRLRDVATIKKSITEKRNIYEANNKPAIWMIFTKESGYNIVKVTDKLIDGIEKIKGNLPKDIVFHKIFEQSDFIKRIVSTTANNGLVGGIFAVLMIYLFLRNWRPTFAIGIAIPLSVVATFIPMYFMKFSLNLTTLAGLALGVGMLVDNAIVVIENIFRHMEEGEDRWTAASSGASEVGMAITASTLTTVSVFLPLLFAGGITGKLSQGYALTVAFSLLASLFVALTLVPMISSKLFSKKSFQDKERSTNEQFEKIRNLYKKSLRIVMAHQKLTLLIVGLLIVLSGGLGYFVGAEFIPSFDSDIVHAVLSMPIGTSFEETKNMAKNIADRMSELPDIELIGLNVGVGEGSEFDAAQGQGLTGSNQAEIFARLKKKSVRKMTSGEVGNYLRNLLPPLEGVNIVVTDIGRAMTNQTGSAVQVKIVGKEFDKMMAIAKDLMAEIKKVRGVKDLDVNLKEGKPEYNVVVDRDKAVNYGLTVGEVAQTIKTYTLGTSAGYLREGGKEYKITVEIPKELRSNKEDVARLPIVTMGGAVLPLEQVATIKEGSGHLQVFREEQARVVTISGNIDSRSLSDVSRDVKKAIDKYRATGALPIGYFIEVRGEYEEMKIMIKDLLIAAFAALLLIYMIMSAEFESFSHPFVIMFTVPLSIAGVILGLLIFGFRISLPSMLGFIILSGIVVNNGIVFVDYINQLRRKGVPKSEAIIQAGGTRLRPILITALTTIIGMLPMALSRSEGSEFRAPMAVAIVGGLTTATFFTLFVVPIIYDKFDSFSKNLQRWATSILHGKESS